MPRKSVKADKSLYQVVREEELGLTRAQASELLEGLSESQIEKIENGKTPATPEDVMLMAKAYKKPELCNYYCSKECPIGKKYVPEIKAKELSQKELDATNTALQEARDELEVVTSQKEKAAKDAKAAIWSAAGSVGQSVAGMFGQSGKDKVIKDQAQQIEALQRELKAERDNHASALRKAVQNAQKPFVEFLSRIASIVGWHPTTITANNAEEAARRVKDVVESRDTWRRSSQKAEEQLKEIKRQEPTQVVTLKR